MSNAIIVHGKPSKEEYYSNDFPSPSNSHWLPWLQKQLLMHDIVTQTPEMPVPYQPNYQAWRAEFERCLVAPDTRLIGHSCGGGFLLRWLSETHTQVDRVVLVAPSLGLDWEDRSFFNAVDPDVANYTKRLVIFGSDNDRPAAIKAIEIYRNTIKNVKYQEFLGYGHFTLKRMGTTEFPELLQALL